MKKRNRKEEMKKKEREIKKEITEKKEKQTKKYTTESKPIDRNDTFEIIELKCRQKKKKRNKMKVIS